MYKVKNNVQKCPKQIADLFQRTDTKYLLKNQEFVIPRLNTITHGKHSIRYIGPKLWNKEDQNVYKTASKSASIHTNETQIFLAIGWSYLHDLSHTFL